MVKQRWRYHPYLNRDVVDVRGEGSEKIVGPIGGVEKRHLSKELAGGKRPSFATA